MVIEQIGSATFVNGLVRIQGLCAGPDGKVRRIGVLEVPGNVAAQVINNLVNTLQTLDSQLKDQRKRKRAQRTNPKKMEKAKRKIK